MNSFNLSFLSSKVAMAALVLIVLLLSVPVAVADSKIDVPINTWIERALPAIGEGPVGDVKHIRIAHNSHNGRLYFQGGDHTGLEFLNSGRNEIYSYSIENNDWRQEHPYCAEADEYQPAGPDQHGWVYDSKRKLFWMTPGYTSPGSLQYCETDKMLLGTMMAFDPATKKWIYDTEWEQPIRPTNRKFAQYDPVTDSIIRFAASTVEIYDISNNTWTINGLAGLGNGAKLGFDYTAIDVPGRVIYMVSPTEGKLLSYDIATQAATYISELPTGIIGLESNYLAWDSLNQVLLWIVNPNSEDLIAFFAYKPETNSWETLPTTHPNGLRVRGRAAVFDPDQNVMLIHGGTKGGANTTFNPYLFLYRYGDGNLVPAPPTILTQPSDVTIMEGEDATFSVVATGGGLAYQWLRDNVPIEGATNASYTLSGVGSLDNGSVYFSKVTNNEGEDISTDATLTVLFDVTAPSIVSAVATHNTRVDIVFSEPVSASSAENTANYQIDLGITVTSATLSEDARSVSLTVSPLTEATTYTVWVSNVTDLAETPNMIAANSRQEFTYLIADGFEDGNADGWTPLDANNWEVKMDEGDMAYCTRNAAPLSGSRLGEYSLLPTAYGDFSLTLSARLGADVDSNANADYAVVFGYQDPENYDYVMFNNNAAYTQLFKVVDGIRATALDTATDDWLTDNAYHEIKVSRVGDEIRVYYDGKRILKANDNSFGKGQIGVGSFNDPACFDDIRVTGEELVTEDTEAPVITLKGANPQQLTVGDPYTELGAMALDNVDDDLSALIETDSSAVNTAVAGSYEVTYKVSDQAGNAAEMIRMVKVEATNVIDIIAPVITLKGANPQRLTVGDPYTELDAIAIDNIDGDISALIETDSSAVNTAVAGSYEVTYKVSDQAGNAAIEMIRIVKVEAASVADIIAPIISLIGDNPQTLTIGASYIELGAMALDNVDDDLSALIDIDSSAVNTAVAGSYEVTYKVSDQAGNVAEMIRMVKVEAASVADIIAPIISLIGDNPQTLTIGASYIELGAMALDNVDDDLSALIDIDSSAVNTEVEGSYNVTYKVSDAAGNTATAVRTVKVTAATVISFASASFAALLGLGLVLWGFRLVRIISSTTNR